MKDTISIASRRTFVGLGAGVVAAAFSASVSGAVQRGFAVVPAPGKMAAETRYRTIDMGGLKDHFSLFYSGSVFREEVKSYFRHSVSRGRMRCFYDCSIVGSLRCARDDALCEIG